MLSRYYNSFLIIFYDYLVYLPVYFVTLIFASLLSFGKLYGRSLVPRLSYPQHTIHRLMLRLKGRAEL